MNALTNFITDTCTSDWVIVLSINRWATTERKIQRQHLGCVISSSPSRTALPQLSKEQQCHPRLGQKAVARYRIVPVNSASRERVAMRFKSHLDEADAVLEIINDPNFEKRIEYCVENPARNRMTARSSLVGWMDRLSSRAVTALQHASDGCEPTATSQKAMMQSPMS